MKNGDVAGISTFIGNYGFIGVKKENDQFYLIMMGRPAMIQLCLASLNMKIQALNIRGFQ